MTREQSCHERAFFDSIFLYETIVREEGMKNEEVRRGFAKAKYAAELFYQRSQETHIYEYLCGTL